MLRTSRSHVAVSADPGCPVVAGIVVVWFCGAVSLQVIFADMQFEKCSV